MGDLLGVVGGTFDPLFVWIELLCSSFPSHLCPSLLPRSWMSLLGQRGWGGGGRHLMLAWLAWFYSMLAWWVVWACLADLQLSSHLLGVKC